MKKTMILAVATLLACTSSTWAAWAKCTGEYAGYFCQWPTGCYAINTGASSNDQANCEIEFNKCIHPVEGGSLFENVTAANVGDGEICDGDWVGGKRPDRVSLGCCRWAGNTKCWDIMSDDVGDEDETPEEMVAMCKTGTNTFWAASCPTSDGSGTCPTTGGITGSSSSSGSSCNITANGSTKCCMYENDPNNCWGINGPNDKNGTVPQTTATCEANSGRVVDSCDDVLTDVKYCNWGTCEGLTPDGYGCLEGGCFMITETQNADCPLSKRVDECPAGTKPSDVVSSSSSSSIPEYAYCVWVATQECSNEGTYTSCPANGELRNTCPYGSSSSGAAVAASSSSGNNSGSSSSSSGADSGSSSSSGANSDTYAYCVYITDKFCLTGPYTATCPAGGALSNDCPFPSSGSGGESPVLSHLVVKGNTLTAMHNAVNLQSMGNATVQVFNLKGNAVRTLKFSQGSYLVPLSGLPKGLYIVKASNGSWKQTIKVTVK